MTFSSPRLRLSQSEESREAIHLAFLVIFFAVLLPDRLRLAGFPSRRTGVERNLREEVCVVYIHFIEEEKDRRDLRVRLWR